MKKQKRLVSIIIILTLVVSFLPTNIVLASDNIIHNDNTGIPDKNFYQCILQELKMKSTDELTKEDAAKITYLRCDDKKIKTIKGVEYLINLEEFGASQNYLTNIDGVKTLTKLAALDVQNNRITNLPNMKKLVNLSLEYTWLECNKLSESVLRRNLPDNILKATWKLRNIIMTQKLKWKLKVPNLKNIKYKNKKIAGTTEKKVTVKLITSKGKTIKKVKSDKRGRFSFTKLNLRKYKGKKLRITAYYFYDDQINSESHYIYLKSVKFKVRKK